ncbi:hypothetical protein Ciccas_013794 [Cichlidogyrus casuarinus]|uniref:Uncharacterized protein n=1 Tax=Cichlidogyrus casuarinus TaxID=1844966 RepID=A0ABD2PPM3_9PLAT
MIHCFNEYLVSQEEEDDFIVNVPSVDTIDEELRARDKAIHSGMFPELVTKQEDESINQTVDNILAQQSAMDRLRTTFVFDRLIDSRLNESVRSNFQLAGSLSILTAGLMGLGRMIVVQDQYLKGNQLTTYLTKESAHRHLLDTSFYQTGKFVTGLLFKIFPMSCGILLGPMAVQALNGRSTPLDHAVAYSATLGLYCAPRGVKRMFAASVIASVPGLLFGFAKYYGDQQFQISFEDLYREHVKKECTLYRLHL